MGLTVPEDLAPVASLVGAPAALFAWDEDKLEAMSTAVGAYARAAAPDLAVTEQAAGQYAAAYAGVSGDAFAERWAADADRTEASGMLETTLKVAAATGIAAGLIKIAKIGVIGHLSWCAGQLRMALSGGIGALNATRATLTTRVAVGKLWQTLNDKLERLVMPHLRRARDLLTSILRNAGQGPRGPGRQLGPRTVLDGRPLADAGVHGGSVRLPASPYEPAAGSGQMNMGRYGKPRRGGNGGNAEIVEGTHGHVPEEAQQAADRQAAEGTGRNQSRDVLDPANWHNQN
ncbi:hypothetical protein [Nonomuraea rhizosphaerae]|uniref:hypothetical protein n=1 Tax=Nonomuraea rhizosphaerae TaxID=2665663 RepID=UPI001C5FF45E|nr:hypothetical protein [Nonomuraea rhizosphaerae]